jgi:hypothetical protein
MPKLLAEFELNKDGTPKYLLRGDQKHYQLRLFMEDVPQDASSVKYVLHATYYEPDRLVPRGMKDFQEYTTSYGDYEIRGVVNRRDGTERFSRLLTDALKERYEGNATKEVLDAINTLKKY